MNCYDCHQTGNDTRAIAICHDCGAGVCQDHTTEGTYNLTVTRALNQRIPVDPPQRRIHCHTCAAAFAAADQLSIGAVVSR